VLVALKLRFASPPEWGSPLRHAPRMYRFTSGGFDK